MKITITKYNKERNVFEVHCPEHPELDRFDPFVSGINNGEEFKELNESMVGREIEIDGYGHGRCILLTGEGEKKYLKEQGQ